MNIIDIHSKLTRGNYGVDLKYLNVMIRLNKRWYEDCRWVFEKMLTKTQKDDLVNWKCNFQYTGKSKELIDKEWIISLSAMKSSQIKEAFSYVFKSRKLNVLKWICENIEITSLELNRLFYTIIDINDKNSFKYQDDIPLVKYIEEKYKHLGEQWWVLGGYRVVWSGVVGSGVKYNL